MGNIKKTLSILLRLFVVMSMVQCFGGKTSPQSVSSSKQQQMLNLGKTAVTSPIKLQNQGKVSITGETIRPHTYLPGVTQSPGETVAQKQLKKQQGPLTEETLASVKLKPVLDTQSSISKSDFKKSPSFSSDDFTKPKSNVTSITTKVETVRSQDQKIFKKIQEPSKQIETAITEKPQLSRAAQISEKVPATPVRGEPLPVDLKKKLSQGVGKQEAVVPQTFTVEDIKKPKQQVAVITEDVSVKPKTFKPITIEEPSPKKVEKAMTGGETVPQQPSQPGKPPVPTRPAPKPPVEEPSPKQTPPPLPTRPAPKKVQEEVEKPGAIAGGKLSTAEAKAAADKARNKKIAAGVAIGAGAAAITGLAVGLGVGLSQDDKQQQAPVPGVGPSDMTTNIVVSPTIEIPTDSGGGSSVVTSVPTPSGVPSVVAPTPTVPVAAPSVAPTETQSATSSTVVVPVAVGKKDEKEEEPKLEEKEPQEAGLIPPPVVEEQEELKQETPKEEEKPAIVPVVVITKEKKEEEPLEVPKKEEKVVVVQKIEERQPVKIEEKQPEKISKKEEFLDEEELIAEERSQEEKEAQLPDEEQKSEVKQTGTVVTPVVISKKTRVTKTRTEVKEHEEKRRAREREEKRRVQERQEKKRRTEREKKKHVKKREEKKRGHEREEKVRPRERKEKEPARKRGEKGKLGKNPIIGSQTQV